MKVRECIKCKSAKYSLIIIYSVTHSNECVRVPERVVRAQSHSQKEGGKCGR